MNDILGGFILFSIFFLIIILINAIILKLSANMAGVKVSTYDSSFWASVVFAIVLWYIMLVSLLPVIDTIFGIILFSIIAFFIIKAIYFVNYTKAMLILVIYMILPVILLLIADYKFELSIYKVLVELFK